MSIRVELAERLADDPNAPYEILTLLMDDKIEVAGPVLSRSVKLSESDLVAVIKRGSEDHQTAIAHRADIGEQICTVLAHKACTRAVVAMLRNGGAKIGVEAFHQIAQRAKVAKDLQQPLVERHDLPAEVARGVYIWVSSALKSALVTRYPNIAESVALSIDDSVAVKPESEPPVSEENAKKLVVKLHAAGQLRASFLVRVLQLGQRELFEHGFAVLLGLDVGAMRRVLYSSSPNDVALACRAAGIDRAAFQLVYNLSRRFRDQPSLLSDVELVKIESVFRSVPKTEALQQLKRTAA